MTEVATARRSGTTPDLSSSSRFNVSFMPTAIHRRTLQPYSVHYSAETQRWIATITRCVSETDDTKNRPFKFSFESEREGRKFAKAFSPPKMVKPMTDQCMVCNTSFGNRCNPHHCRNCGACICAKCSTRWGTSMVPKTFYLNINSMTVRVCKTCDWLSNAFCMALLQGNLNGAMAIQETGNVNLRCTFASINREAMFPVHCATIGGNFALVKWLVETHGCPVSVKIDRSGRKTSVKTSRDRTLVSLAMTGKPKLDILRYLVVDRHLSVLDTNDPSLAPRALEALLRAGVSLEQASSSVNGVNILLDNNDESVSTNIEDACIICCEKSMDCVLIPCGHQICCKECGSHLTTCPVCKVNCSVLRIFRQ